MIQTNSFVRLSWLEFVLKCVQNYRVEREIYIYLGYTIMFFSHQLRQFGPDDFTAVSGITFCVF